MTSEGDLPWKVPYWQPPVLTEELALHHDGPLQCAKREGYLQKRAGKSRVRWNIRYFELVDGELRWWRPAFTEQVRLPRRPKVSLQEPRPRPVRSLDLTKLASVTRTKVKFPYSTRILLRFHEAYTKYELELRAEREIIILEWYKVLSRFTMERYELDKAFEDKVTEGSTAMSDGDSSSEEAFGLEDEG